MLFNLDKQSKKNILENYRHEALISSLRKIEQKKKEKEEDKFNLEQKEMRQKEMLDMINKERIEKKENLKKEYNLMLQRTKGFLPKNNHLIVKNWGQKKEPLYLPALNSESYSFNNKNNEKKKSILNIKNNFNNLNLNQQEKEILKQVDHMNEFLTDEQNEKEVKQYFKIRKENRHHFYKDLLFSQYQEAINKNFTLYGILSKGVLKLEDNIAILPGICIRVNSNETKTYPIYGRITMLQSEKNLMDYIIPGGMGNLGIFWGLDFNLENDNLEGNILSLVEKEGNIFTKLGVKCHLLRKLINIENKSFGKHLEYVTDIRKGELLLLNFDFNTVGGHVINVKGNNKDEIYFDLKKPMCVEISNFS